LCDHGGSIAPSNRDYQAVHEAASGHPDATTSPADAGSRIEVGGWIDRH
jgi:hypothetical protein